MAEDPLRSSFIGRNREARWLEHHALSRAGLRWPVFVTGLGGIGKTALIRTVLNSRSRDIGVRWLDLSRESEPALGLDDFVRGLYSDRPPRDTVVVVDDAERVTDTQIVQATSRILNIKAVRSVVFGSRRVPPSTTARVEHLALAPLETSDAEQLLRMLASLDPAGNLVRDALRASGGHPLAIVLLAHLLNQTPDAAPDVIAGSAYQVDKAILNPPVDIVVAARPQIVIARNALVDALRNRPDAVYDLPPRQFEELVADLLTDMGWEVELTGATRDGGKDILAYLNTDLGRLLCLVEAKRYRRDRVVGVELVRSLYGTLVDHQATSAMLITTSGFSPDARQFQRRHQYQLALRDYADIIGWVHRYKRVVL